MGKKIVRVYDPENPKVKANIPKWIEEGRTIYEVSEQNGKAVSDVWQIAVLNGQAKERTGYPTQKPVALLDRVIKASLDQRRCCIRPILRVCYHVRSSRTLAKGVDRD